PPQGGREFLGLVGLEHHVVDVAVHPVLAALERLDDRMSGCARMFRCVLVLGRVAAADVPGTLAEPQVHRGVPYLQTLLSALALRPGDSNLIEMRADLRRCPRAASSPFIRVC